MLYQRSYLTLHVAHTGIFTIWSRHIFVHVGNVKFDRRYVCTESPEHHVDGRVGEQEVSRFGGLWTVTSGGLRKDDK